MAASAAREWLGEGTIAGAGPGASSTLRARARKASGSREPGPQQAGQERQHPVRHEGGVRTRLEHEIDGEKAEPEAQGLLPYRRPHDFDELVAAEQPIGPPPGGRSRVELAGIREPVEHVPLERLGRPAHPAQPGPARPFAGFTPDCARWATSETRPGSTFGVIDTATGEESQPACRPPVPPVSDGQVSARQTPSSEPEAQPGRDRRAEGRVGGIRRSGAQLGDPARPHEGGGGDPAEVDRAEVGDRER